MRQFLATTLILLIETFFFHSALTARVEAVSNLNGLVFATSQSQSEYVEFLRRHFPEFFSAPATYSMSPSENIQDEQNFLRWFLTPEVQKIIQSETIPREEMKRIEISARTEQLQNGMVISDQSLQALIQEFKIMLSENSDPVAFFQSLRGHLKNIGSVSSQGMLVGLINCLPPELKTQAFPLELDERILFLKRHLTDEMVEKNFRGFGVKTVQAKLAEVAEVLQLENKVVKMALFAYWQSQKKDNESIRSILGPRRQEFNQYVATLVNDQLDNKDAKKVRELSASNIKNLFEGNIVLGKFSVWIPQRTFRIEEVPPPLGVYRGCVNGDCFTKYAFGFAFAPAERTFFVYNEQRRLIFTIYAMAVKVNNQTALLIHEIGSVNTNTENVELVVRGLFKNIKDLGYSDLLIDHKSMHHSSFGSHLLRLNYNGRPAYGSLPSLTTSVQHFDTESRKLIGNYLQGTIGQTRLAKAGFRSTYVYENDLASYHTHASFFRADDSRAFRIDTKVASATNFLARYLGGLVACEMMF